jgi:hypothetical protein
MANLLTRLFKSKAARETELREEQAKLARAEDMGRQTAQTVTALIDAFRDEKVTPVARNMLSAFKQAIESHHKDATSEAAIAVLADFKGKLERLRQDAFFGLWDSLGESKYTFIKTGLKDDYDHYINEKFGAVWTATNELAVGETSHCVLRISGHITDEMHAATTSATCATSRTTQKSGMSADTSSHTIGDLGR